MINHEKIFRYGIDKISLYNFSLHTEKNFKKLIEDKENVMKEKTIITDELFSIVNSYTLYQGEEGIEESYFNRITFNPNKILTGDNICNSTSEDLEKAIEKLTDILKEKDIYIDFSSAKVADIEINLNVSIDFNEYSEVFMLLFKQNEYSKLISALTNSNIVKELRIDESFFTRLSKSVRFKAYSKDREKIESYCKSLERHDFRYYFSKSREKELQKEK